MKAEAGGQPPVFLQIPDRRRNPQRCIGQGKLQVELKPEGIMAEGFFIPIQPEVGARRVGCQKRKQSVSREAVSGEREDLAIQPVLVVGQSANNRKQDRRPAFPDRWIAIPLQVVAHPVPQGKKLRAEWVNFRSQLLRGNLDQGMICHG